MTPDTCKHCYGELFFLGQLGNLHWFRCRNCGADQCSVPA